MNSIILEIYRYTILKIHGFEFYAFNINSMN